MNKHWAHAAVAIAFLLAGACTAGDDSDTAAIGTEPPAATDTGTDAVDTEAPTDVPTGPSPGVTDGAVKVGITYVDLDAVRQFVDLDQGDYEASYRAVIDDLNANGGINGRMIEPVFAAVSPLGTAPAEEVCVRLTEDEDVFAILGFFQDDAVICPVADHATAIIGGVMTQARYDRAEAPWFTTEAGEDSDLDALRAMADEGEIGDKLGVFASILSEPQLDPMLEVLEEEGIEPVDVAVLDAPTDDLAAQNQATAVIMERFRTAGIDQILAVGSAAVPLANGLAPVDYRPQLLFTSQVSVEAYTTGVEPDLSMFEGAVLGTIDNEVYEEPAMQDCLAIVGAVVGDIADPDDLEPSDPNPFVSASAACRNVNLFAAIAEAAGEDLNYGSFQAAGESLGAVHLPGAVDDYDYGPYPSLDGDQPMFLFDWDANESEFVVRED
jgi:hypothetical protein